MVANEKREANVVIPKTLQGTVPTSTRWYSNWSGQKYIVGFYKLLDTLAFKCYTTGYCFPFHSTQKETSYPLIHHSEWRQSSFVSYKTTRHLSLPDFMRC